MSYPPGSSFFNMPFGVFCSYKSAAAKAGSRRKSLVHTSRCARFAGLYQAQGRNVGNTAARGEGVAKHIASVRSPSNRTCTFTWLTPEFYHPHAWTTTSRQSKISLKLEKRTVTMGSAGNTLWFCAARSIDQLTGRALLKEATRHIARGDNNGWRIAKPGLWSRLYFS